MIFHLIGHIIAAIGSACDMYYSRDFQVHGMKEGNEWFDDDDAPDGDGDPQIGPNIIVSAVLLVGVTAPLAFFGGYWAQVGTGVFAGAYGLVRLYIGFNNRRLKRLSRIEQNAMLDEFLATGNPKALGKPKINDKWIWYPKFPLYAESVVNVGLGEALRRVHTRLLGLARERNF